MEFCVLWKWSKMKWNSSSFLENRTFDQRLVKENLIDKWNIYGDIYKTRTDYRQFLESYVIRVLIIKIRLIFSFFLFENEIIRSRFIWFQLLFQYLYFNNNKLIEYILKICYILISKRKNCWFFLFQSERLATKIQTC